MTSRSRFRSIFESSRGYDRASIVVPFLVISIALGVLAYRSYQLSVRMERGLDSLATQYLAYAAEMTARRADAAVRSAMTNAWEEWQEIERGTPLPTFSELQTWVRRNNWIVAAIYLPDADPINAVYFSEQNDAASQGRMTHEFYTANGTIRYTYDPSRLLGYARRAIRQQPMIKASSLADTLRIPAQSQIQLVPTGEQTGLIQTSEGFSVIVPLAAPLEGTSVRASVKTSYIASGWGSYRTVSLWSAFIAFVLLAIGAAFAIRGLARESDATKLRAALIANVSHELRTPLSMIRLGAETLKRSTKLTERERNDLEDSILREVIHLNHLVENVLDVARLQRSEKPLAFSPVLPEDLVVALISDYKSWIESKGFTVELDIDDLIDEQMWDREAVSRALLNLVDNAIKYSSTDKRLTISLRETKDWIVLAVRDHGLGMPPKELKRIFEPYYRASFSDIETRRGAGLGLTLVYQIVKGHGGKVEVISAPGEGSEFRLHFPKAATESEHAGSAILEAGRA